MLQLRRQKVFVYVCACVCVCVCVDKEVLVFVHKQFTLWSKGKKIFSEFETDLPFIFSKREHWYLVVCVCVCVCVCVFSCSIVSDALQSHGL